MFICLADVALDSRFRGVGKEEGTASGENWWLFPPTWLPHKAPF